MNIKPKVQAAGYAGSATIFVVYIASLLGTDVPTEVAQAFTVLVAFVAGYFKTA